MSSKYPISSLPENRGCFDRKTECPTYPCIHTPSHDPDYLDDREDIYKDMKFHNLLWQLFRAQSDPRWRPMVPPSPEDLRRCEAKFERCKRMEEKKDQINRDKINHYRRRREYACRSRKEHAERLKKLPALRDLDPTD